MQSRAMAWRGSWSCQMTPLRQATAAATARGPDQTVEIARTVATIAFETRSVRICRNLATLKQAMRPWHDAPVGRDLAEILAPVTERS